MKAAPVVGFPGFAVVVAANASPVGEADGAEGAGLIGTEYYNANQTLIETEQSSEIYFRKLFKMSAVCCDFASFWTICSDFITKKEDFKVKYFSLD